MDKFNDDDSLKTLLNEVEYISLEIERLTEPKTDADPPRFLTNKEIMYILNDVPIFPALTRDIGAAARRSIIRKEKSTLREVLLAPDALEEFKQIYISKFNLSKIEPNSAVGFTAAEGISAPASQQAFNSFQNAGSSKNMLGGIEGFLETLAGQRRHLAFMVVHYKKRVSLEEILLDKRYALRTVTVADCIIDETVETASSLYTMGHPDWYPFYLATIDPTVVPPSNGWILRLYLNLGALQYHRIRPKQIADLLSSEKDVNGISVVKCIYSPVLKYEDMDTIILDAYINNVEAIIGDEKTGKVNIKDLDPQLAGLFYFRNIFIPKFSTFKLKGLDGISDVEPIGIHIPMSFYSEYPTNRYLDEYSILREKYNNYYFVKLNQVYMRSNNIVLEDIEMLLRSVGLNDFINVKSIPELKEDFNDLDLLVKLHPRPSDFPTSETYSVLNWIKYRVDKDNKDVDVYRKSQKELRRDILNKLNPDTKKEERKNIVIQANKIKIYKEPSMITKAATLYYAETSGTDYGSLFNMDDVDYTRSYTNDMNELLYYYGIEAVKTYIIKDLLILVKLSDTYIDPRHALLIADWMTCLGTITPTTAKGMKKHNVGAIANAAFREPMKGFKNEAMYNRSDKLGGVAGPIAIGTYIEIGTGLVDIKPTNKLRTKALFDNMKKQGKKLNLTVGSKIISLLEQPDLISPLDRTKEQPKIEITELNIPLLAGPQDTNFKEGEISVTVPGLDQIFPLVSKEIRSAVKNASECNPPKIEMVTSITPRGSDHLSEPLPIAPIVISDSAVKFDATEKPPETIVAGETVNIDDLF